MRVPIAFDPHNLSPESRCSGCLAEIYEQPGEENRHELLDCIRHLASEISYLKGEVAMLHGAVAKEES